MPLLGSLRTDWVHSRYPLSKVSRRCVDKSTPSGPLAPAASSPAPSGVAPRVTVSEGRLTSCSRYDAVEEQAKFHMAMAPPSGNVSSVKMSLSSKRLPMCLPDTSMKVRVQLVGGTPICTKAAPPLGHDHGTLATVRSLSSAVCHEMSSRTAPLPL